MARYKHIDRNPKFIPVVLDAQLMTGSFEYTLDYLIDHELDLSRFEPVTLIEKMKREIDSPEGRRKYSERMGTVEPVFGNLRYNKGLDRFTLRSQIKVDTQWNLFCLVHNIEKLAHCGYGARR